MCNLQHILISLKENFYLKLIFINFSTTFVVSEKSSGKNEQLFMQFVMHMDANNRLPLLCY